MTLLFEPKSFERIVKANLESGMAAQAEDIVFKAMKEYEAAVRKELAKVVLGLVENNYNIRTTEHSLVIEVLHLDVT